MIHRHLKRIAVLILLHHEAYSQTGWRRRGVAGWRFREELESVPDMKLPEVLPYLTGRGWLDRVDVREPSRGKPLWIYRISQRGARVIENLHGWGYYEIPEPWGFDTTDDLRALYPPAEAWQALSVLRRQAGLSKGVRRFGVPGWMSAAEVRRAAPQALPKHLAWLLDQRLIERRRPTGERIPAGAWFYRITALGMRAELVEVSGIQTSPPRFVHMQIREAQAPAKRDVEAALRSLIAPDHPAPVMPPMQTSSGRAGSDPPPEAPGIAAEDGS